MTAEDVRRVAEEMRQAWLREPADPWTLCARIGIAAGLEIAAAWGYRSRPMEFEYLTADQVLDLIDKHGSPVVAAASRKGHGLTGHLPLTALRASLGIEQVTMYRRVRQEPTDER